MRYYSGNSRMRQGNEGSASSMLAWLASCGHRILEQSDEQLTPRDDISVPASAVLPMAIIHVDPLIAASNWPLGVMLAMPGIIVLLLSAFMFARNSRERMANLLLGFLGSLAAMIALGYLSQIPEAKWMMEGNARVIVASATVVVGSLTGVAVSVSIRGILLLLYRTARRRRQP
jgi:hypothetical protein